MNKDSRTIKDIESLFNLYKIKYTINFTKDTKPSWASPPDNHIMLNVYNFTRRQLLSVAFHEISHILLHRLNKYTMCSGGNNTKYLKKFGILYELATDRYAAKLLKFHYPKYNYLTTYGEDGRKWYQSWLRSL